EPAMVTPLPATLAPATSTIAVPAPAPSPQAGIVSDGPIGPTAPASPTQLIVAAPASRALTTTGAASATQQGTEPNTKLTLAAQAPLPVRPTRVKKPTGLIRAHRWTERCVSALGAVVVTMLFAWIAQPALSIAKQSERAPVSPGLGPINVEVRLARLPAVEGL